MSKKATALLAAVIASFVGFVVWIVIDVVELAKGDAFGFDVFEDYTDN